MKRKRYLMTVVVGLALALGVVGIGSALAQSGGPAVQSGGAAGFTYQGQLKSSGSPVNGACVFGFGLWDAPSTGTQLGVTQTVTTTVTNGLFTVTLNGAGEFGGNAFTGNARYLGIGVKCGSESSLTSLGRQWLTAAPYALYARNNWGLSGNAGTSASNLLGTTDNMTLTLAVSNTAVLRLVPAVLSPNLIGGYSGNSVSPGVHGATIGGGGQSVFINTVSGDYGTISGGYNNTAGGGGPATTVGGGSGNTASGSQATVGGGQNNAASDTYTTVGGGFNNTASNYAATVPGGFANIASGNYSFAAGQFARALHNGAFVWADFSTTNPISSTTTNQFLVRASGGITLYTNSTATTGARLSPGSGSWSSVSDRTLKANFAPVDGVAILNQLNLVPIQTWNYRAQDASIRHIGPMAQDFYAAFNVGEDDTHISTVDADGVALAAIQGLYQVVQAKDEKIAALEARVAALEQQTGKPTTDQNLPSPLPLGWLFFGGLLLVNVGFLLGWTIKKGVRS